ncbi:MAG: hypothetical protein KDC95_08035 [Planctomycetes bacterium]|nr:hypothetical protein [Planctomycetota bacterium]
MNHHGYGSDDRNFEDFRKRKNRQLRQRRLAEGQAGLFQHGIANSAARVIEEGEQREAQDMQLKREMDEFVRDTTKLAAGVLGEVNEQKDRQVQSQVSGEMQEFFSSPPSPGGADEHARPQPSDVQSQTPAQPPRAVISLEEHLSSQSMRVTPSEPTPVPQHVQSSGRHAAQRPDPELDEYTEFRGEALSDFCDSDDLTELPDDPTVLDDSVREFERISHLEPSCCDEDVPAPRAPAPEASTPKAPLLPIAFARLVSDPDRCKATLKCLVGGGILDREEARHIYAEMKERWAHVIDE